LKPEILDGLLYRKKYLYAILSLLTHLADMKLVEMMQDLKSTASREDIRVKIKKFFKLETFINVNNKKKKESETKYDLKSVEDIDGLEEDLYRHASTQCNGCSLPASLFAHTLRNWVTHKRGPNMVDIIGAQIDNQETSGEKPVFVHVPHKKKNKRTAVSRELKVQEMPAVYNPNRAKRKRKTTDNDVPVEGVENTSPKKRKKIHDDKDRECKSLMTSKRSVWSQPEDHFLLLSRVASLLLDPMCHINICVPIVVVRDVLHEYLAVSRTKTSVAVQRRIAFLINNHNTNQSVQDWVAELRQDDSFADVRKPEVPRTHVEVWKTEYLDILNRVLKKFMNNHRSQDEPAFPEKVDLSEYTLIDSADITSSKSHKKLFKDPHNVIDIHVAVVNSVLLASLLTKLSEDDNDARIQFSYNLFRIYRKYPDTLIRSVVASLKKCYAITSIKSDRSSKTTAMRNTGVTPYKISSQYKFILQTKFGMDSLIPSLKSITDYKLGEFSERTTASLASSILTTRNASFSIEIPDDFVSLDEESPFMKNQESTSSRKAYSRSILYVVREQLSNKTHKDFNTKLQDILRVGHCRLSLNVKNIVKPKETFKKQLEMMMSNVLMVRYPPSNTEINIIKLIQSKKEVGARWEDFQTLPNPPTIDKLNSMIERNIIYRVGVNNFTWVHRESVSPWVVNSYESESSPRGESSSELSVKKHQGGKIVQYIAKVWRKPTGEVDLKTIFTFMSSIIGFLMSHPGQTKDAILAHFHICAPAAQLMEVIELLDSAGCLVTTTLPVSPKPRLFSSRFTTNDQQQEETFYEASASSLLILSHIRSEMNV
jgi:hypothetical protein